MKIYETIIILNPEVMTEPIKENYREEIQTYSCSKLVKCDDIGLKKLAYTVKGCETGYYLVFKYLADHTNISHLTSLLNRDKTVLKHITVQSVESKLSDFEDYYPEDNNDNTTPVHNEIDAYDVLFGLAKYN